MKRKMIGAAAAYMSGLFFASFFTKASGLGILLAVVVITLLYGKRRSFKTVDYAVLTVAFTAAFTVCTAYTLMYRDRVTVYDGQEGSFSGEVTDIALHDGGNASYILKGRINDDLCAKVTYYGTDLGAVYGDTVNINQCRFKIPDSDYLFDGETYYKSQGIYLSIGSAKEVTLIQCHRRPLKNALMKYRERMISRFSEELGTECGSFLAGMVFGEKQGLDENVKTALYRSGIGHILAVSGLHVSIIAALIMTLMRRLKMNRYMAFILMDVGIVLLVIMANTPVSAVRAAIMMNFLYSASLFRRQNDPLNSLAAASLLICAVQPYSIYSSGFMLSLSGTFGIAVFTPYVAGKTEFHSISGKLRYVFIAGICTSLSVFPLCMLYFDETSIITPFTNVLLVPICTASMIVGFLFILTGGLLPILPAAGGLIEIVLTVSDTLSRAGIFHAAQGGELISVLLITLGVCVLFIYLFYGKRRTVIAASAAAVMVFICGYTVQGMIYRNRLNVAVLGKGYNAAVVVAYKGRTDVIDLSAHYKDASYVRKYLSVNGIDRVDSLILTDKVQSQFVSYTDALEFCPIGRCMVYGDIPIAGAAQAEPVGDRGIIENSKDYSIMFENGRLTVETDDKRVDVIPCGSAPREGSDLTVFFGNKGKKTETFNRQCLYLDNIDDADNSGMNNTEIIIGKKIRIRRL